MSLRYLMCLVLVGVSSWQACSALTTQLKATLAPVLLARAWDRGRAGESMPRPWPWADTWPVARFRFAGEDVDLFVLSDTTGRTLAFGPGLLPGSALPGEPGNAILAGHRDSHFRFLRLLETHDRFSIETGDGTVHWFQVTDTAVVDSRDTRLKLDADQSMVTLVTCYPFDALHAGGPLRYVVVAHHLPAGLPLPVADGRSSRQGWD